MVIAVMGEQDRTRGSDTESGRPDGPDGDRRRGPSAGIAERSRSSADDGAAELVERLLAADDDELGRVLHAAMRDLAVATDVDRASLVALDAVHDSTGVVTGWERDGHALPPSLFRAAGAQVPLSSFRRSTAELRAGRVVRVDEVGAGFADDAVERDYWRGEGVAALLHAPVVSGSEVVGYVALHAARATMWDDDQARWATAYAAVLSGALRRVGRVRHRQAAGARDESSIATTMELVASLSHELKTPLHAIAGHAELLEPEVVTDEGRSSLVLIRRSVHHLTSLVDDLIATVRPTSDVTTALPDVLSEALRRFEPVAAARQISVLSFHVDRDAELPLDPAKSRQVIRCLLSGALLAVGNESVVRWYTPDDDPSVALALELDSTRPISHEALSFPIARAVLLDRATIEVVRAEALEAAEAVHVLVRFDRAA